MKIAVIGTGYVGQVTGTCFAELGNDVFCVDVDPRKVEVLSSGKPTIYETGLSDMLSRNVSTGRLRFTTDAKEAVEFADIIFICVGTPEAADGSADLQYVFSAAESIGEHMNGYKVIVTKSTVPLGTTKKVQETIAKKTTHPFDVANNPEFLKEGMAVRDFMAPERIVVGVSSERAKEMLQQLYAPLVRQDRPLFLTDIHTSEMIKYASNCMLATRISFMNMLSHLCDKTGADVKKVARGMGFDSRIGSRFLQAGIGFGGSCFPKDVHALVKSLEDHDCNASLLTSVLSINEDQKKYFFSRLKESLEGIENPVVTIWGLSFKPGTDDIREAPALVHLKELQSLGVRVQAYDPIAMEEAKKEFPNAQYCADAYAALSGSHALLIATEWNDFRMLDRKRMKEVMARPLVFDGRNMMDPEEMREHGFTYVSVGRP